MPLTIERRGATVAVHVPPEPDARDETGRPLYIVDTAALQDLRDAQRQLQVAYGLEPHGSVPDSETLMYFTPVVAQTRMEISLVEWDALVGRVERLEQVLALEVEAEEALVKRLEEMTAQGVLVPPEQKGGA